MNRDERDAKQESSIPISSRVDICNLATLDHYWTKNEVYIRSMSQLVNWSINLLVEVLKGNEVLSVEYSSVTDAYRWLVGRKLLQPSLQKNTLKKISTALAFENLRGEGIDPREYVPQLYNRMHKKGSIDVPETSVECGKANSIEPSKYFDEEVSDKLKEERMEYVKRAIQEYGAQNPNAMTQGIQKAQNIVESVIDKKIDDYKNTVKEKMTDGEFEEFVKKDESKLNDLNAELDKILVRSKMERTDNE